MKYEYMSSQITRHPMDWADIMNKYGRDGWRYVERLPSFSDGFYLFLFEREVPSPPAKQQTQKDAA